MNDQPFCFPIAARDLPLDGKRFSVAANGEQRARLAEALGILAVESLTGEFDVRPRAGGAVSIEGEVFGEVVQACVVTLEPVRQEVREDVELTLVPAEGGVGLRRGEAPEGDAESLDSYRYGRIDLGAIAAEHLALGLDPYPRKPGVEFAGHAEGETMPAESPFGVLAGLKDAK